MKCVDTWCQMYSFYLWFLPGIPPGGYFTNQDNSNQHQFYGMYESLYPRDKLMWLHFDAQISFNLKAFWLLCWYHRAIMVATRVYNCCVMRKDLCDYWINVTDPLTLVKIGRYCKTLLLETVFVPFSPTFKMLLVKVIAPRSLHLLQHSHYHCAIEATILNLYE